MANDAGPRPLVVKSGAGADQPERCVQALTVSATAVAAGADVSLWLMGEAVWLATTGAGPEITLPGSPPVGDLVATVLTSGRITVCTQCAARRGLEPADFAEGVRVAGAAAYVEEVLAERVQALVY